MAKKPNTDADRVEVRISFGTTVFISGPAVAVSATVASLKAQGLFTGGHFYQAGPDGIVHKPDEGPAGSD
jgi:hypothetical protein